MTRFKALLLSPLILSVLVAVGLAGCGADPVAPPANRKIYRVEITLTATDPVFVEAAKIEVDGVDDGIFLKAVSEPLESGGFATAIYFAERNWGAE